jgi:DNA-binding CsgD family transcriptional regulator
MNGAEIAEVHTLLRFASAGLTLKERQSVTGWLAGMPDSEIAPQMNTTRGGVWMLRQNAFLKMRRRLAVLGTRSADQLISEERCA